MTILVTGSAGHLGEALMRTFRAAGRPALGVDVKPSAFTDRVGSIVDPGFVRSCVRGVDAVVHAATLHKPHVATHSHRDFLDVNLTGTLNLLDASAAAGVRSFVYTSSTSAFGDALTPAPGEPAAWITEDVGSIPKNIYGVTKVAAESLCELFARKRGLPVIVLRVARFFLDPDDDRAVRERYDTLNVQANELLHRRLDLEDVVGACLLALDKAPGFGFRRYIVSATTPFGPEHLAAVREDAPSVVRALYPQCDALFAARGWRLFPTIGRVYVNALARFELGWSPKVDFGLVLDRLAAGEDFRSDLALEVGAKGYHDQVFEDGPYPVA